MAERLRIGILFGGESVEHEVSVVSAQGVASAIDHSRFEAVPIGITRDGVWLTPEETAAALASIPPGSYQPLPRMEGRGLISRPGAIQTLRDLDVVFPLVHGTNGEDGTLQGLLELAGVPYVGAGVTASALGMDKALQKALFQRVGLPVVPHLVVLRSRWNADPLEVGRQIEAELSYPLFVKPANGGSSVGVSKVRSREDLGEAFAEAFRHDRKVLVEEAMAGREIECSVLGNDEPAASPLGEIIPSREFYDYVAKYIDNSTQLKVPVELPTPLTERIQAMAIAAFKAIDCAGMARVDFFLHDDQPYVNEINTIPGFTPISMYPKLWEVAGLSYTGLITRLIELALERDRERRRT